MYPRGGISLRQSIFLPFLAHSSAQTFATCSGTGLGGLRTTSTLKPITCSAHLLPLPSYPASSHRCLRRESPVRADSSRSLSPSWSGTFALCTLAFSTSPSVSTSRCRLECLEPSCFRRIPSALHPPRWSSPTGSRRSLRSVEGFCPILGVGARAKQSACAPRCHPLST